MANSVSSWARTIACAVAEDVADGDARPAHDRIAEPDVRINDDALAIVGRHRPGLESRLRGESEQERRSVRGRPVIEDSNFVLEPRSETIALHLEVTARLDIEREAFGRAEVARESQGGVR